MLWKPKRRISARVGDAFQSNYIAAPMSLSDGSYRGNWSNSPTYVARDVVFYNDSSYIAIQANTDKPPDSNADLWSIVAQQSVSGTVFSSGGVVTFVTNSVAYLPGFGMLSSVLSTEADGQMLAGLGCTAITLTVVADQNANLTISLRRNGTSVASCSLANSNSCSASTLGINVVSTDLMGYRISGTTLFSNTRLRVATSCY